MRHRRLRCCLPHPPPLPPPPSSIAAAFSSAPLPFLPPPSCRLPHHHHPRPAPSADAVPPATAVNLAYVLSFLKVLTASDVNSGGRFSVPRTGTESVFLRLDYGAGLPFQNISIRPRRACTMVFIRDQVGGAGVLGIKRCKRTFLGVTVECEGRVSMEFVVDEEVVEQWRRMMGRG